MINVRLGLDIRMTEIMIGMVSILMCFSAFNLLLSCCSTKDRDFQGSVPHQASRTPT
jgi:hypothetical protein